MADELAAIVGNDERIPWRYSKDWNRIIELIKKDPAKLVPLLLELSLDWRSACLCQVAMRCGHDEGLVAVVEIMLQLGADPASKTEDGETPLYAAVCGNSLKACELILRRGVNPNVQNNHGDVPLHMTSAKGLTESCALLLQCGAAVDVKNVDQETPLHRAAVTASTECCELLLQYGAISNSQDQSGQTPLHNAAQVGSVACCEILLDYGGDLVIQDNDGRLPVQVVENDDETTRLFLISQMCTWDANLFRDFCRKGRAKALAQYLDNFRIIPDPPREPCQVAVYFHDLHQFYGPPWLALTDTPLNDVLTSTEDVRALVAHPVFDRVLTLKWGGRVGLRLESLMPLVYVYVAIRFLIGLFLSTLSKRLTKRLLWFSSSFGRSMFLSESLLFLIMLVSTYTSFVSSDGSPGSKTSMVTSVMLLLLEALDIARRQWSYFRYVTNWINLSAYVGVLVLGCFFSEQPSSDDVQMARAIVIVLLCFCGLDYLQMISLTGLLIAITFKMLNDVIKFVVLYGVFQFGFSAAFLLLFHDQGSRYDSYGNSFMATFLMLVGDFDSDLFLRLDGTKAIVGNTLVVVYLVGAMVMLLNLLIAMMSTTYQQVLDSAKTARSIARAETIMRMESLLPHHIRVHLYDSVLFSKNSADRKYGRGREMYEAAHSHDRLKSPNQSTERMGNRNHAHVTPIVVSENKPTSSPTDVLQTTISQHDTAVTAFTANEATMDPPRSEAANAVDQPTQSLGQPAMHLPISVARVPREKTNWKSATRMRGSYHRTHFVTLDDCELFELVEGDESAGKISDLRQTQEDLKAHTAELIEKLKGDLKLEFEQQLAKQHELTIKHLEKKIESALQKLISSVDCTLDGET